MNVIVVSLVLNIMLLKCHAIHLRIVGGKDAHLDIFQMVVRIEIRLVFLLTQPNEVQHHHICTGAAIAPTWVLTAAHCMGELKEIKYNNYDTHSFKMAGVIRYGSAVGDPWSNNSFSEIVDLIHHPAYFQVQVPDRGAYVSNDIGLLKTWPIVLDNYAKLSAVDYNSLVGLAAVAVGYGLTEQDGELSTTLNLRKSLQIVNVLVVECYRGFKEKPFPFLCISNKCSQASSICPGDSGGPVLQSSSVIGVNSVTFGNCVPENVKEAKWFTGGIVPISPYIEWIIDQMKMPRESQT